MNNVIITEVPKFYSCFVYLGISQIAHLPSHVALKHSLIVKQCYL